WTAEFADLIHTLEAVTNQGRSTSRREPVSMMPVGEPANLASRLDPLRLRTVGLRGLVEEMVAALGSSLTRSKVLVAGTMGVLSGVIVAVAGSVGQFLPWAEWVWVAVGGLLLAVGVAGNVLLTQMTYVELSRLRPARWPEVRLGWGTFSCRLFFA